MVGDSWYSFGISFRNSSVQERQKFVFSEEDLELFYEFVLPKHECFGFIVSTCNRTTFFLHGKHPDRVEKTFMETMSHGEDILEVGYRCIGIKAVTHLFEVGAGMDSQILGDFEIIGQLRRAFQFSKEHGASSGDIERGVNCAIHFSRRVKNETGFSSGTSSTSYAALRFLQFALPDFNQAKILIVGIGEIGHKTLDNIIAVRGSENITIVNRTDETARITAREKSIDFLPWSKWQSTLESFDAVICASRAPQYILSADDLTHDHPKVFVDLSMPTCFDPSLGDIPGVTLVHVDDISSFIEEQLSSRIDSLPQVRLILQQDIEKFRQSQRAQRAVPFIRKLQDSLEDRWSRAQKNPEQIERLSSKIESRLFESVRRDPKQMYILKKWLRD